MYSLVPNRVITVLGAEADASKNAKAVRFECEERVSPSEKQNLFSARHSDPTKLHERALGFLQRPSENLRKIAVELRLDQFCRLPKVACTLGGKTTGAAAHANEKFPICSKDLCWREPHRPLERFECLRSNFVGREICNTLPDN